MKKLHFIDELSAEWDHDQEEKENKSGGICCAFVLMLMLMLFWIALEVSRGENEKE